MKAAGIIVEYNPFHNGHKYHIEKTREITRCEVLIAVTSGHFVQRGEPSIIDKWQKTEAALENGVDLVIEMPFIYTNQSAAQFAKAGVDLLKLAQVSDIVFGSETNNIEELQEIASMPININNLKENLKTGMGFPKAYGLMAKEYLPNDILAIAYLRELIGLDITPHSIQRSSEYHSLSLDSEIVSASAIRNAVKNNLDISRYTPVSIDSDFPELKDYYPYLKSLLICQNKEYLNKLFLVDEGIENHLSEIADKYETFEEFLKNATTRRYSKARIQRTLLSILMQNEREYIRKMPKIDTLQVLGFNSIGQKYLKELKEKEVRVASRYNQIPKPYRNTQYKAAVIYSMFKENQKEFLKREICGPIIKD